MSDTIIEARLACGGAGYMAEYGIERFYRDVRIFRLYEGTSQIMQLVIGRNMMKSQR